MSRFRSVLVLVLALAGCPRPSPAPEQPSIDTFELSPSAVPIAGQSVRVIWATTGAIQVLLGNEAVSTSDEKVLFVTPGQVLSLYATSGHGTVTKELVVGHVPGEPVNGTVVNLAGQPLADAEVKIGPLTAKTDSAGRFTISDAPRPYSARVSGKNYGIMNFIGLTTDEPTLWTESFGRSSGSTATLRATVTGWPDAGAETVRELIAVGRESLATESDTPNGPEMRLQWNGDAGGDFMLLAYQYDVAYPDQPRYLAAAEPVRLHVDAGEVRTLSLNVTPPSLGLARANVSLPSWASYAIVGEYLLMPGFTPLRLDSVSRTSGSISAEFPAWDAGTFHFSLLATRYAAGTCQPYQSVSALTEAVLLDGGTLTVDLGDAPVPRACVGDVLPRDGRLQWDYRTGAVCVVHAFTNFPVGSENYLTVAGSLPVSALPGSDFAREYSWQLECYPDFTSPDDGLSPAFREVRSETRPGRSASASDMTFTVQ